MATPLPLVSCLTVTRDRLDLVTRAIRCFLTQTYPHRELVIIGDGHPEMIRFVNSLADNRVRYSYEQTPGKTLGELRNLSLELANGALVTQWDDDDWYHPSRLQIQVAHLQHTGADISILIREILAWPERGLYSLSRERLWENTFLATKSLLSPYPSASKGEDTVQLDDTLKCGVKLAKLYMPELYIRTVHGGNTWDEQHFERLFSRAVSSLSPHSQQRTVARLREEQPFR